VQLHALSKFFFTGEVHRQLLKEEPDYFMSLLATPTRDKTAARRFINPVGRPPLVKVNKILHAGAKTATKKHRKEVMERQDPTGHVRYGSNYKDPSVTSEKLERRKEGNYVGKNLHEYL